MSEHKVSSALKPGPPRVSQSRRRRHRRPARPIGAGRHAQDHARPAVESQNHRGHAHAQPGQDRLQGRHLLAGRPGRAREAEQLRRRRAHHRKGARPRRELHRYLVDLRRPRALERAIRGQGHGPPPQRGLPRHQDQGAHPRRLHAHDREIARNCCKPITWTSGSCTTSAP